MTFVDLMRMAKKFAENRARIKFSRAKFIQSSTSIQSFLLWVVPHEVWWKIVTLSQRKDYLSSVNDSSQIHSTSTIEER